MTEAINYFQSIFTFKNYSSTNFSKSENQLAHALVKESRNFSQTGDQEMENGKTTLNIAIDADHKILNENLAQIALWHYQRAADKYRRAVDGFEQAAKIWRQSKRQRLMEIEAHQMAERAMKAEAAVKFLRDFSEQN